MKDVKTMTDKAYIVVNEQQEHEVLEVLCANEMKYFDGTSSQFRPLTGFPYVIYESDNSNVLKSGRVPKIKYSTDILYDGRKEEQMSEKYVVSQEFMNKLEEWKDNRVVVTFINGTDISNLSTSIDDWWLDNLPGKECNNRLIAIIRWVNGEDVFEVEKPKKWVVRSKYSSEAGGHLYVSLFIGRGIKDTTTLWGINNATKFSTKEEAESWANSHQEVVEVVDV